MTRLRACLPTVIVSEHCSGPDDSLDYRGPGIEIFWRGFGLTIAALRRRPRRPDTSAREHDT